MPKVSKLFLTSVLALFSFLILYSDWHGKAAVDLSNPYVPGEIIVKLKREASVNTLAVLRAFNVETLSTTLNLYHLKYPTSVEMSTLLTKVKSLPQIEYAEPNYIYSIGVVPQESEMITDPEFSKLWGLHNTGQKDGNGQEGTAGSDMDAVQAWVIGTGSHEIKVAVIDTGVDYKHEDLATNIAKNDGEVGEYTDAEGNIKHKEDDKVDNDGNGYIDDVIGWNFVGKTNDPMDDHSHGTHVSGTIGAIGNNQVGVVGVNWKVSIIPVKFLGAGGSGTLADAVKAIDYATKRKAHAMNNSWGGGGFSQALADVIEEANKAGILFVAAAGNNRGNNDKNPHYPSNYKSDNVISVAATDNKDQLASFSNYGQKTVHVAAPGVSIYSTTPNNKYGYMSGTSMATPHVAGLAALILGENPTMTLAELKARIFETSEYIAKLKRKMIWGRVNTYNALTNTKPPRPQPTDPKLWVDKEHSLSSAHPYENNKEYTFTITHPGAIKMRVHFSKFDVEGSYDFVHIKDKNGEIVASYDGTLEPFSSEEVEGDTIQIVLKTDGYMAKYGFDIDKYQYVEKLGTTPTKPKKPKKPKGRF